MEQGMGTQGTTPGGGEKRKRAQNLVPIKITDIQMAEEDLKIEGRDVGMVDVIGLVKSVEQAATKTIYILDDGTGEIEAIHWTDTESSDTNISATAVTEGMRGRVMGSVRSQGMKKHLMVFRISPVGSEEEAKCHEVECLWAKLKLRQLNEKEFSHATFGNSKNEGQATFGNTKNEGQVTFGNSKHESVFKLMRGCSREEGLSRDEMFQALRGRITRKDLDDTLEYLSGEGHIYSTTDDDHFKSTDG